MSVPILRRVEDWSRESSTYEDAVARNGRYVVIRNDRAIRCGKFAYERKIEGDFMDANASLLIDGVELEVDLAPIL